MNVPPGVNPALYAKALADIRALRPYGTYQAAPVKLPPTERPDCGSRRGYRQHQTAGEQTCPRCRGANAAADRRLAATGTTLGAP